MRIMLSIVWTLAMIVATVNANSARAEVPKQILNGKSFQWVRGQLWVYGPNAQEGTLVAQQPELPPTDKAAAKSQVTPEELIKALQKASQQKL